MVMALRQHLYGVEVRSPLQVVRKGGGLLLGERLLGEQLVLQTLALLLKTTARGKPQ